MSGRKWCAVPTHCFDSVRFFPSCLSFSFGVCCLLLAASLFRYVAREQISVRCVVVVTVAAIQRRTHLSTHRRTSIAQINFRQWNMHHLTGVVRERCVYLALEASSSVSGAIWMRVWQRHSGQRSCGCAIMRFTRMMSTKWECRECGDRIECGIIWENWEFRLTKDRARISFSISPWAMTWGESNFDINCESHRMAFQNCGRSQRSWRTRGEKKSIFNLT